MNFIIILHVKCFFRTYCDIIMITPNYTVVTTNNNILVCIKL